MLKLWSAIFILARILEWFVFWYPGRPETEVATCDQGFLLRRAAMNEDSPADDFDDFGQTVGIHFDMHATACLDLPLVRSFCSVLNLLEVRRFLCVYVLCQQQFSCCSWQKCALEHARVS